jgi:hypothetical protein
MKLLAILIAVSVFAVEPAVALTVVQKTAPKPVVTKAHRPLPPKPKLLRSNPNRFTAIRLQGTDPYDAPDDEFLCASSARKPKVIDFEPVDDDEELSDYVKTRLLVARARAMQKYREVRA